jgi:hypothetical protein
LARKGPVTVDTDKLALGLAQIRVIDSATNIGKVNPASAASDSIGSLANTKFVGNTDWYKHESGFPLLEDYTIPIREGAMLECTFEEIKPINLSLAHGIDISGGGYTSNSGEVDLGGRSAPAYIRMEAVYTFPNGTDSMVIIFPRAQVSANVEVDLQSEDNAGVPITFESKDSSSNVTGGNAIWDDKPLGRLGWYDTTFLT